MHNKAEVINFDNGSVHKSINSYLDFLLLKGKKNTYNSYKGFFKDFFKFVFNKEASIITWSELVKLTDEKVIDYIKCLKDKGQKNKTINNKLSALKSLFEELQKKEKNIKPSIFDKKLDEELEEDNHYGALSQREIELFLAFCEKENYKPITKKMFFKTAVRTALRKSALLNLSWSKLKKEQDVNTKEWIWVIKTHDKTGKVIKPLTDEFYEELKQILKESTLSNDSIFQVSDETLIDTFNRFCESHNIDKIGRNLAPFHSFRKSSTDIVYEITGDIKKTQQHGNWKSPDMPMTIYLGQNTNLVDQPSYYAFDLKETMQDSLENYTKEELIAAIKKSPAFVTREIFKHINK
jgi:integrase